MSEYCKIALTANELMAEARSSTNIDLLDEKAIEPLQVLVRSFNKDACMTEENAMWVEGYLLRILRNRLRMQRDYANHPEIADLEITAPVFICGMARTGSTKLQKLLAASGDFNWLPFWQSLNPALYTGNPDESPEPRIKDTDEYCDVMYSIAPGQRFTHEYATHEPEEEGFLMIHSLHSLCVGSIQLTGFIEWLMQTDFMRMQLEYLRDSLKYLQWQGLQSESKRWVLKAPHYFGFEPLIKELFPDASLIMPHRHPKESIPSLLSFFIHFNKPASSGEMRPPACVDANAAQINQHLINREQCNDINMLDIYYKDITGSVAEVMERVYSHINMPLSVDSLERTLAWNNSNPIHAKGGHRYTLEEFGLTEEKIEEKFSGYIALIDQLFQTRAA